jgi:hypothetical protein
MQISMDGISEHRHADSPDRVGPGLIAWIAAALATELVVVIVAAVSWVSALR